MANDPNRFANEPAVELPIRGPLDLRGEQIGNVADPTQPCDAVNLQTLESMAETLPPLQQAIRVVEFAEGRMTNRDDTGLATGGTLMYNAQPVSWTVSRNPQGLVALETYDGAPITAAATLAGDPTADLVLRITYNEGGFETNRVWSFGGDPLVYEFDSTRGILKELRDTGNVSSITSRGTFNITDGYQIDSRGQVTEI